MSEGRLIKNKLRIVRQVGRGGMGYVYEVFHEGLRVTRALKQIVGDLQDNPEIERRFLHEAQMMARLEHPHIVRVFDIDQEPGFGTYLLMEFIRGRDLGELLRQQGRFSYAETLRIGIAVASALDCAHRAGLVHRDIKPANILIEDGTGRPVVTDFGIAKEVESANDESFTRTGSFVGTYRYSSREQIRAEKGVPIDGRADVYSLGVVLYEIFAGRKYLAGMPELKIASCVGYQDDWLPELDYPEPPPPLFGALIEQAIAPDRDKRIRSAAELVARLEECRREDLIGGTTGPGGIASGADAPLAAATSSSAATTQTAPQTSSAGGELTATVLDEPQRSGPATETRSQWVALLQGLRGAVDDQAGEFERLLKELIALDLPRDDFRQLDDMSQILSRVERAESAGQYQEAASNLQGLSDRIQQLNARIEHSLGEAIERTASELGDAWRALAAGAGDLLDPAATRAFENLVGGVTGLLEAGEWTGAREALREARTRLDQATADTRNRARARAGATLGELRATFESLAARSAFTASGSGIDVLATERAVDGLIADGALTDALRRAEDALRVARDVTARLDAEERAAVDAARSAAEQARGALDLDEARALAADDLRRAESALEGASAAVAAGRLPEAAHLYGEAATAFRATADTARRAATAQIDEARAALRALLARASGAPDEVVSDARRAARRVLEGELPAARPAALAALADASSLVQQAIADVGPFQAARGAEAAAQQARERAAALGAEKGDLAAGAALLDEARAALGRRAYDAARAAFARAATAFEDAANAAVARDESQRIAAARAQIDEGLRDLDVTIASELAGAEIRRVLQARDAVDAAEQAGDRAAALDAGGAALGALRDAAQALLAGLGERSSALQEEIAGLAQRAGGLLAPERRSELERGVQAVERALVQRDARAAAAALDEAWRRVGDVRVALDERARGIASETLSAIRAALSELATLDPAADADVQPDALAASVDALLGDERFADARDTVGQGLARVRAVLDATRERQRVAASEAGERARSARGAIDEAATREVAADELAAIDARLDDAVRAERDGELVAAARLYAGVADALETLQRDVRARQIEQYEVERQALEATLARAADAPAEIVGKARDEARALIEATVAGDVRRASATVAERRRALEALLEEATAFAAAREQQDVARAAEQRVAALSPSRRQIKAPAALQRDADAAFAKKRWPLAAETYARAAEAWTALERELADALAKERAAAEAAERESAERRAAAERERERRAAEEAARPKAAEEAAAKQREREAAAAQERERAALEAKQREQAAREAKAREQAAREAQQREQVEAKRRDAEARAAREAKERADAAREQQARADAAREQQRADAARKEKERAAARDARARRDEPARDVADEATVVGARDAAADATIVATRDAASEATVVGGPTTLVGDATRIEQEVPAAKPKSGLPMPALAGGAALLVAAAGVALWLSQRAPEPAPITTAKIEEPAKPAVAPQKVEPVQEPATMVEPAQEPATKVEPAQEPATKVEPAPQASAAPAPKADEPQAVAPAEEPAVQPEPSAEPVQVAKVAPEEPVAPPKLRISGFTPSADEVSVKEGAKQAFSIDVAGGEAGRKPKIAWRLDDRVVASDVARFEYAPGFDAASDAPKNLEVVVGEGPDAQTKSWRVAVANVNRKPKLTTSPRAGGKVEAKLGDTIELTAKVEDEDGDPIAYAWKVDGKPVADDGPKLSLPVSGDRTVSVTASDGTVETSATWQIAAIKPVLKLATTPSRLERLRFEKPQEFALSVPPGTDGVEAEWTVDGKKVATGTRFTFTNDDASKVRRTPVEIKVAARDANGATFERAWKVVVEPPAPELTSVTPPAGTIEVTPGSSETFELAAASPVGGQDLTYVFQVDGKQAAKGRSPSFTYRVDGDRPRRVTGFVQDNFDQVSSRTEWTLAPRPGTGTASTGTTTGTTGATGDIVRSARSWLEEYQNAFNAKDARRLGELRGLSPDKVAELQRVLDDQQDLRVTFSNVQIDRIDDQRARITYTRSDDFTDVRGGPVSRTGVVEQTVGLQNGRVVELETRRR